MPAQSKEQILIIHLKTVACVAKAMAIKLGLPPSLTNIIYTTGILHDIGKGIKYPNDSTPGYPLHHEIGWAFLTQKTGCMSILNAVYWHHAKPIHTQLKKKTYDDADEILNTLSKKDLNTLEKLWLKLEDLIDTSLIGNLIPGTVEVPDMFMKDGSMNRNDNAEFMLIRTCVISADRFISSLSSDVSEFLNNKKAMKAVENMLQGRIEGDIKPEDWSHSPRARGLKYDVDRFNLQKRIVKKIDDERTSIVKAPAGHGKTLIGLLWSQAKKGKVLWVCPRNAIADAVYENLKKEIEIFGLSCTIELYRTGARQNTNIDDNRPEFDSDIIVTNIDAILSPMINDNLAGRLFTVYGAHVVFHEFHEFVSDAPLFAAFITYMRARHRIANNCKTLLLSATPSLVHVLWDIKDEKETLILPNEKEHYPPQHNGSYKLEFIDNFPEKSSPGDLLICNAVSEAQKNFRIGDYTFIIHHRYTDKDRVSKDIVIKKYFGKKGEGIKKHSLSSALVAQTAIDVSFLHLYDSVCSPEFTLQRIGKIDRWGNYQSYSPGITFMDNSGEKTEAGAIRTVYDMGLQKKWYAFLCTNLKEASSVDLKTMYNIYNEFYKINRKDIIVYLMEQYRIGMNGYRKDMEFLGLIKFNPVMIPNNENVNGNKIKRQGKTLRNPDGSYFYTVELVGRPNVWLSPEDVLSEGFELHSRYENNGDLNRGLLNSGAMLTRLKGLVKCGYSGWTRQSKGKKGLPSSLKAWFYNARNSETPLPDFSRKYDPILGVIKT
jgi:hypothetical protein